MKIALRDVAAVIRSKNSGPYELTFDVMLKEDEMFEKIRKANIFNAKMIAELYRIPESDVLSIVFFPNARALKATIVRPLPSGDLGERDVYGAQQHAPLMNYTFEL
ncbi:MAG: DUF4387 domain-containing protein [Lachnospiraceae bacterium]|nr:DUF4387 domain-containing protein [Lachnospiraceae bacterium]